MAETAINLTFFSTSKWDKEIRWSTTLLTLTSLIWKIYIWVCKVPWKCTNPDDSKWPETAPSDPPVFTPLISVAIKVLSEISFCPVINQKEVFVVLFHKLKYNIGMLKKTLLALLATTLILTSATSTTHIHKIPLRLSSDYVYYATLSFGSQQQPMEVLLDTGSRTLAVFCDLCQRGCPKHLEFKTSESDSYHNMTC